MIKNIDIIVDLQFGSTGKGLIAGYLAEWGGYDTVVNANMPNAGHTYINDEGRKWVHKVLPNGIVAPDIENVLIGPGAVFDPARLVKEIEDSKDILEGVNILIHPNAVVLRLEHGELERANLNGISSTMQGSGAALIEKMARGTSSCLAKDVLKNDVQLGRYVTTIEEYQSIIRDSDNILAEGAQGYSLGLNGRFWPYCTSRECTPARFMSDMGLPLKMLRKVVGTARIHPIRVGNTEGGTSGPCYPDQEEISWEDIGVPPELTTVTQRERRVFTYSKQQMEEAIFECAPDEIFLNFCNYTNKKMVRRIKRHINGIQKGTVVKYLGYGPARQDIVEPKWNE